ncbi:MAG: TlpA family protein disulfide reductase, partial [Acidobacteriota bacterium]|nr:TlpA family protein disulfide reductase [Acidobacteriota bacterium]
MRKASNGILLLIIGVIFAAVFFTRDGILNEPAPAFSLPDVAGGKIDLASYRGRPVLLAFWTTSCPICRSELPLLSQLAPELRGKGIEVLAIELGGPEGVADYLRDYRIRLRTLTDSDGTVGRAYGA